MSNTDSQSEVHWLVKIAQELRDTKTLSLTAKSLHIDPDLAHPALSILGEFVDRCRFDIQPEFLMGYAFGLQQAGLIDEVVFGAIRDYVGSDGDNDPTSNVGNTFN